MVRIQLCSDLHLERNSKHIVASRYVSHVPGTDILVLAGDILSIKDTRYFDFLKQVSPLYKTILIVFGNHEYYKTNFYDMALNVQKFKDTLKTEGLTGVTVLDRNAITIGDIVFIGATLWSYIPKRAEPMCEYMVNDYYKILGFSVAKSNSLHDLDKTYIEDTIQYSKLNHPERKICVITHHPPIRSGVQDEKFGNTVLDFAFTNNLGSLAEKVDLWLCGHTHYCAKVRHKKCTIVLNCHGYRSERTGYKNDLVLEL